MFFLSNGDMLRVLLLVILFCHVIGVLPIFGYPPASIYVQHVVLLVFSVSTHNQGSNNAGLCTRERESTTIVRTVSRAELFIIYP